VIVRGWAVVLAIVCGAGMATPALAQVSRPGAPPRPAPVRGDTIRQRGDTTVARDTVAKANFAPPDSVMLRLLNTPGYSVTQYQGEQISFDAVTRAIQLTTKAIVQRDSQLVKSDTIKYSGSGSEVRVGTGGACSSRPGRRRSSAEGRGRMTSPAAGRA
jgi:hypothetical protein